MVIVNGFRHTNTMTKKLGQDFSLCVQHYNLLGKEQLSFHSQIISHQLASTCIKLKLVLENYHSVPHTSCIALLYGGKAWCEKSLKDFLLLSILHIDQRLSIVNANWDG